MFPSLLLQEAEARLSVTVNQHAFAPLVTEGGPSIEESQPDRERQDKESGGEAFKSGERRCTSVVLSARQFTKLFAYA